MTTITINRATVEQALKALERADKISGYANNKKVITALRAALAQQAEPVEGPETVDQRVGSLVESALQAVAEKIGDQCAVWYGIGARDVEEVLREAARYGLVHGTLAEPVLQTCNCRWDGEVQVQQCTLHEAHIDAIHEWAERAKVAERKLAQQAEPVEPVAYRHLHEDGWEYHDAPTGEDCAECQALYTAPPQRKPLMEEEIDALPWNGSPRQFARAVERALEEKNRGR